MRKLVIKTASITLAVTIGLMFLLFGALCLFSPKSVAKTFESLGGQSVSIFFYEKQYDKTENIDDLYVLVLNLDYQKNASKTREYLTEFLSIDGVKDYCKNLDTSNSKMSTYEYLSGKCACAIYLDTGIGDTIRFLEQSVADGYGDYNAYSMVISEFSDVLTDEELIAIKTSIQSLSRSNQYTNRDINIINELLGENHGDN